MYTQHCDGLIDLSRPVGSERRRGFQPPWETFYKYICPKCKATRVVHASSFLGRTPQPGKGAILCDGPIPGFAPTYRGRD